MSINNARDPRSLLVREKYFSLRPKPLERWLWQQGLPQAAERVFWLHWEEGMKRGDWCSELSLRQVARECCVDPSTVTRAYQVLRGLGLIKREDPGRDAANPFAQAIAITEVRLPRDLICELDRAPNRTRRAGALLGAPAADVPISPSGVVYRKPHAVGATLPAPAAARVARFDRADTRALMSRLSDTERAEFFVASKDRRTAMTFDEATALTPEERGRVLGVLAQISGSRPAPRSQAPEASRAAIYSGPRRLSPLDAAELRKRILKVVPMAAAPEVFRQVLWSVEEGALRRFEANLAANIAVKKVREAAWTRPNRMPPQWLRSAAPETCGGA